MLLFLVGAVGFIIKKNIIAVFLCLELMLNAVNLSFVAFASTSVRSTARYSCFL